MNSALRVVVSDLACRRGERVLFSGLCFVVRQGDALVVTGPNGVGKTTLLRAMAGFVQPFAGTALIEGAGDDVSIAERCHFVGHRDGLRSALSVRENLAFARGLMGQDGDTIDAAADRLHLRRLLDLPVGVLSAGQRRRAALARLRVVSRPVWLLDEPTSALDAASREIVRDMIATHVQAGGIVIAATHLPLGVAARSLAFAPDGTAAVSETPEVRA